MLACVCQPADPSIFRRSPIPLGAPPVKITNRGALPKPGKTIRITPAITDAPSIKNKIQFGNKVCDFGGGAEAENGGILNNRASRSVAKIKDDLDTVKDSTMTTSLVDTKSKKPKGGVKRNEPNLISAKADRTKGISENATTFNTASESMNCDRKLERKANDFQKVFSMLLGL